MYSRCIIPRLQVLIGQRTEIEEEEKDDENVDLQVELEKDRRKRNRKRGNVAPPQKKLKTKDDENEVVKDNDVDDDEKKSNEPKASKAIETLNLFSIFNSNSKFKNSPGSQARKKPKPKRTYLPKVKFKTLDKYFNNNIDGKEDDKSL